MLDKSLKSRKTLHSKKVDLKFKQNFARGENAVVKKSMLKIGKILREKTMYSKMFDLKSRENFARG